MSTNAASIEGSTFCTMPEVDVADQRGGSRRRHEVLDDDAVFEHRDLGVPRALVRRLGADPVAHHHDPFDGLAAGQELGLGQDRWAAPSGVASVAAPLPLGLQPSGAVDALDLGVRRAVAAHRRRSCRARRPLVHHGVGRVVGRCGLVVRRRRSPTCGAGAGGGGGCAPSAEPSSSSSASSESSPSSPSVVLGVGGVAWPAFWPRRCGSSSSPRRLVGSALLAASAATTATAATAPPVGRSIALIVVFVVGVGIVGVGVGVLVGVRRRLRPLSTGCGATNSGM